MVEQQSTQSAQLDHIVVLLSYRELLDPPPWITSNFTLSPGGRHADGKTENRLIIFRDGTYIELIAFVDDDAANKDGHWWGDKRYGVIDWALTSATVDHVSGVAARLDEWRSKQKGGPLADLAYAQPRRGGRQKPDGQEIAWFVTFPEGAKRGLAPFWCHDVTPRQQRVPADPRGLDHPSGAIGISNLAIHTPVSAPLRGAYEAILAASGKPTADGANKDGWAWTINVPRPLDAGPIARISAWPSSDREPTHGVDAEIKIELAVESSGEARVPGPISEKVGLHGEGQIDISFTRAESTGP